MFDATGKRIGFTWPRSSTAVPTARTASQRRSPRPRYARTITRLGRMAERYPGDTAECRTVGADAAMLSDESQPVRHARHSRRRIGATESEESGDQRHRRQRDEENPRSREHANRAAGDRQREGLDDGSPERHVAQRGPAHHGAHERREAAEHTGVPEVIAE